ncbi:MAG: nicotinamide-nucleotide adenylyltransferase [Methanocalculus sp. MSAO_Arc1]|uniref:nicotinamide-nucleotide adenylyltransferase n=1 Tax=Methanocalculus TaxID=71151 RepID=UPI000FEECF66|nr:MULTISPECIES: nicotinamide-nucleotide adenylyltransferase [unclassified Methanocalculus]MCP1663151.1 nicotinamide-nucleotide adenylyltransferase [Methanocalculus sp. AMF5]RQD79359.1 MAG: nicotinamide-nucleotide adenylyltransferase [Methanocalculus sp. MSAO_Arc1]
MKRGFYIGRFQPYHNGHQAVLEGIAREVDEIIIGVGSAQLSHDAENPFTAGERVLMITRALEDIGCPFYVIPIEDLRRNALWVAHVTSMTPPFDICYTSNPLVIQLFREAGINVQSPPMYRRETLSGTAIRRLILAKGAWEHCVPEAVVHVIREIRGVERIQTIAENDYE